MTPLFHVRAAAPSERSDAYITRRPDGLPTFTWMAPDPLPLLDARRLLADATRLCGGTLSLSVFRAEG